MSGSPATASRHAPPCPWTAALALSVPAASAALHYASDDRRGDAVELHFADDLLDSLPRNALFIYSGDDYWEGITYAQVVDHTRTDVITLDTAQSASASISCRCAGSIRRSTFRLCRTAPLPPSTGSSVPILARMPSSSTGCRLRRDLRGRSSGSTTASPSGLSGWGAFAIPMPSTSLTQQRTSICTIQRRATPPPSWERLIAQDYAACAFSLGLALSSRGGGADIAAAERMFAVSIGLAPTLADAYRYLGTLLLLHGGSRSEVVLLFRRYLSLSPRAPEAATVRRALLQLETGLPAAG